MGKIKDWWSDEYHRGTVGIIGTTVVVGLTCFVLGRVYGQTESDINYIPTIIKLVGRAGKLEGENELLREMLENTASKEE